MSARILHGLILAGFAVSATATPAAAAARWSGWLSLEGRGFLRAPLFDEQHGSVLSVAARPELYWRSADRRQSLTVAGFGRLDQHDEERTHLDLRELLYVYSADRWELKAGVGRIFWGVTEAAHLVDVINSTDGIENPDGEDKLGQPMVQFTWISDSGVLSAFVLPGFRRPTYPGVTGRLRAPLPIDADRVEFESADGARHVDWALRASRTLGPLDVGLSHFSGTARTARYRVDRTATGRDVLVPIHDLVDQTGADVQATLGGWLWKLEVISVEGPAGRHTAAAGGYEYTIGAVFGTGADLGVLTEYLFDDRGKVSGGPFDNDLFVGARLALNNVSGAAILAGAITDLDNGTNALLVEASSRLRDGLTIEIEARASIGADAADPLYAFRRDAYIQGTLTRYF